MVEGDDETRSPSSHYHRKLEKSINQYGITIDENNLVITSNMPLVATADFPHTSMPSRPSMPEEHENLNSTLHDVAQELMTFMQSGLTIVSNFDGLHIPRDIKQKNGSKLLAEYMAQSDLPLIPPQIMLEEQSRLGYYRSIFFNTSCIKSEGTAKVLLPRIKPYSTWFATGFALHNKWGLSIAQPIRLPTSQGLYVLGQCPRQVRVGENVLLTWGANNYLGEDLSNVILRIRASPDFDLMEESRPQKVVSSKDKDYKFTITSLQSLGVETRSMIFVPKHSGIMQIIIEIESKSGGDYDVLTVDVHESGIKREELKAHFFDLTSDKKTHGPIVEKMTESPNLRAVAFSVSGKFIIN
jgi:hypothetical protein